MAVRTNVESDRNAVEDDKLGAHPPKGIRLVIDVRQMADDLFKAILVLEIICIAAYVLAFITNDKEQ